MLFRSRRVVAGLGPDGSSSSEAGDPIAATVYDALTATAIVGRTDLVAQVPHFFALKNANRDSLVIIEPDDKDEGIDLAMLWHRKQGKRSEEHTSELQSLMRTSYA